MQRLILTAIAALVFSAARSETNSIADVGNTHLLIEGITEAFQNIHFEKRDQALKRLRNLKHELPCLAEIKKSKKKPPPIIIHGEMHTQTGCIRDGITLQLASKNRQIALGLEGVEYPRPVIDILSGKAVKNSMGVEEAHNYFLTMMTAAYIENAEILQGKESEKYITPEEIINFETIRSARASWKRVDLSRFTNEDEKEWSELFTEYVDTKEKDDPDVEEGFKERVAIHLETTKMRRALNIVLKQWILKLGELIVHEKTLHTPDNLGFLLAMFLHDVDTGNSSQEISAALLHKELRSHLMLEFSGRHYCKEWKKGKPVHFIYGDDHTRTIHLTFKKMFAPAFDEAWIRENIRYRDSARINEWHDFIADATGASKPRRARPLHVEYDNYNIPYLVKVAKNTRWVLILQHPPIEITDAFGEKLALTGTIRGYKTGVALTEKEIKDMSAEFTKEAFDKYGDDAEIGELLKKISKSSDKK